MGASEAELEKGSWGAVAGPESGQGGFGSRMSRAPCCSPLSEAGENLGRI